MASGSTVQIAAAFSKIVFSASAGETDLVLRRLTLSDLSAEREGVSLQTETCLFFLWGKSSGEEKGESEAEGRNGTDGA